MALRGYPTVPDMMTSKTLAQNIIYRHNTSIDVLDDDELSLLRDWISNPTIANGTSLLTSRDMLNEDGTIKKTNGCCSLVGYLIYRNCLTSDNPALTDRDISMLQKWFADGTVETPTTREMLDNHWLAQNLIIRHRTPIDVFDDDLLAYLGRFVRDPTLKEDLLKERGLLDDDAEHDEPGTKALANGSLTGYCVATWGTDKSVFTPRDLELLREWYEADGPNAVERAEQAGARPKL